MMEKKKFIVLVSILLVAIIGVIGAIIVDLKNNEGVPIDDGAIVGEIVLDEDASELPELSAHAEDDYVLSDEPATYEGNDYELSDEPAAYEPATVPADSADVPDDAVLQDFSAQTDDPNGVFYVSTEWAAECEGLYAKIGDRFYTLMNQLPVSTIDKYGVGYVIAPDGGDIVGDKAYIYLRDIIDLKDSVPSATRNAMVAAGDFSPLQVHKNDVLAVFGDSIGDYISLFKLEFVGYTIPAVQVDQSMNYYPVVNNILPNNVIENHSGVFTLDNQAVEDVRNLEYGKEYLYECYFGTEYREIKITANSRCYSINKRDEIKLAIEPGKFGYSTVDISELEPGFYTYKCNTVFEVID